MDRVLRLFGLRYATAALVLVALAALYGAASLSRPGPRAGATGQGARVPVTSALAVCPGHEGGRLSVQSTPGTPAGTAPRGGPGRAEVTATGGGEPLGALVALGQGWSKDQDTAKDSFAVRADGALAAGLEAEQTTHWPKGRDRGLAATRCAAPGTDLWFVGPGPVAAERLELQLTNADAQPASVDVTALSGEGPLDTPDGRGTLVEPHTTRTVLLGESAEGLGDIVGTARDLALRVHATGGRVAASLRVRIGAGKGIDRVPVSPVPATSVIVPGVPSGEGARRLMVGVPGAEDARIRVQVITPSGSFAPHGQDILDAPAETVSAVDLENALSGKPAAVRLVSDRPIVAGFEARRGADVAYGTATAPFEQAVVADGRFAPALTLTAPAGAASVRITAIGGQGAGTPQDVAVPAGRTVETKIAAPRGGEKGFGAMITVKAGSGPVHAARTLSAGKGDGALFTVVPVVPAVSTVRLPAVGDSQTALLF
ncbi:DUF5719 family protein [Spirillospora sp. NBC_01491]|uniref:DUF5719 family protein n=1 Tax=Spirillospora sp. NBC_01491 TaxID=2976007 RepID=UPI002E37D360|nr:DUF5719 family protein [Spirillospora sp. NBC_01491]